MKWQTTCMGKIKNSKRDFFKSLRNLFLTYFLGQLLLTKQTKAKKNKPRVVVIGAGFGGAGCISYLSKFSKILDLYVFDKHSSIQTGPFSNLVIGDIFTPQDITFKPKFSSNVEFYDKRVKFIQSEKKKIVFSDNQSFSYDILILSPGIGFKSKNIEGYSDENIYLTPDCWDGEKNLADFKKRLNDLENNSKVLISAPDYPYRCPPAPYERASMIAYYLKKKKLNFTITILDSKDSFTKKENFFSEWKKNYNNSINWISRKEGGKVLSIKNKEVLTEKGLKFSGDIINIIPDQKASNIIHQSELINEDWCTVNPINFELRGHKDIYVLGDSIDAGDMPKSGFSANSQAQALSMNLINMLLQKKYTDPVFLNTCYSFSTNDRAFSITAWYRLNSSKDRIVSLGSKESQLLASDLERIDESKEAFGWYKNITKMMYG